MRREVTFKNTMQSLLSYMEGLEKGNVVQFVDVPVTDIVEVMMSSSVSAVRSKARCIRCVTVSNIIIKHQGIFLLLRELGKNASVAKTLGITHVDDPSLYNAFYTHYKALLGDRHVRHLSQDKERFPTFVLFIGAKIQETKIIPRSNISLLIITTRPFDYDAKEEYKKREAKSCYAQKVTFVESETSLQSSGERFLQSRYSRKSFLEGNYMEKKPA